jgi:hypothetical protein
VNTGPGFAACVVLQLVAPPMNRVELDVEVEIRIVPPIYWSLVHAHHVRQRKSEEGIVRSRYALKAIHEGG